MMKIIVTFGFVILSSIFSFGQSTSYEDWAARLKTPEARVVGKVNVQDAGFDFYNSGAGRQLFLQVLGERGLPERRDPNMDSKQFEAETKEARIEAARRNNELVEQRDLRIKAANTLVPSTSPIKTIQMDFTALGYQQAIRGDVSLMANLQVAADTGFNVAVDKFVTLTEGSVSDLKSLMEMIANHYTSKNKLIITLGVGFSPSVDATDTGVRSASALAKYLALNPELIELLKAKGIHFLAYDKNSGKSFKTLGDFYQSDSWKSINRQMANASREINSDRFSDSEKELKKLKARKSTPALRAEISEMELKINQTLARAYASNIVTDSILGTKAVGPSGVAEILINQANKSIATEVSVKSKASSGTKFSPAEAAARAAKGVK